jgi:Zn-finger nucleic acid-binding protein
MSQVTCIKCGKVLKDNTLKVGSSICIECAGELVDKMSIEELVAHAKVGWDALIDEATRYQKIRPKDDLNKRYKKYKGDSK